MRGSAQNMKRTFNQNGFTLIEVIFSIALLGIIALFILPMAMYGIKYAKWNNIRLTALNLGYSQVEWLKTLDYDYLGLDISNYSPNGIVKGDLYMNEENSSPLEIEGIEYTLNTNITWKEAKSSTNEPVPTATKKIDVTVEAKDPFSSIKREYSVLGSLVAKESERDPTYPGHLKIYTFFQEASFPKKNVMVKVSYDSGGLVSLTNTDDEGRALIGNLNEGKYKVEPISWEHSELMVMPNGVMNNIPNPMYQVEKNILIPKWDKNDPPSYSSNSFYIDLPGYVNLLQSDIYPNATLSIKPTNGSYNPPEGEPIDHMLLKTSLEKINHTKLWRLWTYGYDITFENENYYLIEKENGTLWDGSFDMNKIYEASYEELLLAFGLKNSGALRKTNDGLNRINEIYVEFTSEISSLELLKSVKFCINNIIIDSTTYTISSVNNGKNDKIKITFNNPSIEITEDEIYFEIIDFSTLENNYGMKLAKDLNKCTLNLVE